MGFVEWFWGLFSPRRKRVDSFVLKVFDDRSAACAAAKATGVAALVRSGTKEKWLILACPCGCGGEIALNLMKSHRPAWSARASVQGRLSVHPSIDATSCGAHFWLVDGKVRWVD